MALWGGRFEGQTDPLFREFNDSLRFDRALVEYDITASIAWAGALRDAKVLTADELSRLVAALNEIAADVRASPEHINEAHDEDVHSWVEARLVERVGALGKKLHTGRSRNDQVATDLRLYVRHQVDQRIRELREVQQSIIRLAERERETIIPGLTHLQHAQPILFAHWCLAYFEMLDRDAARFQDALRRVDLCPLGSGALAGTSYPIDRNKLAKNLEFTGPTLNSLDAVADRDFVIEVLATSGLCALHLSRLAEDLIIYSSQEFGLMEMDDSVTSGSSLMPQKKNPDAMELVRGKCGRIIAAHLSATMMMKGLPLTYNKDMQEDKEPLIDAMQHLSLCLRMIPRVLDGLKVNREVCRRAAAAGYTNATELADYLVDAGVPFRDAHEIVGRLVRHAIAAKKPLEDLPLEELRRFDSRIESNVFARLSLESTLKRRDILGGTAPARVQAALKDAKSRMSHT